MPTEKIDATHLFLVCIDHRCTDDITHAAPEIVNDRRNGGERYDLIALPGASLGVLQTEHPSWGEAFWSQLKIALALHTKIHTLVVVDHLYCGAYKVLCPGYEHNMKKAHETMTRRLGEAMLARNIFLKFERWLLEPMSPNAHTWGARSLDSPPRCPQFVLCRPRG